jgi:transposase
MKQLRVVGIDLAQLVLHLVGMDAHGTILGRKRRYRAQVMACIAPLPPTLMGREACGVAPDWACRFREHGHEEKLMAPQCVQPYVKTHNNDRRDAEAVTRPTMRFVPTKTSTSKTFKPSTVDANGSWGSVRPSSMQSTG